MSQPLQSGNAPIRARSPAVGIAQSSGASSHEMVRAVMNRLQSHPSLRFTRLNVHQCDHDAVCLEGFLESNVDEIDLCEVVRGIHGIKLVLNHVVTAHPPEAAAQQND